MHTPQTPAVPIADWLKIGPRSVERPADGGRTRIGILDDPMPGWLDQAGILAPAGAGYCLDWWIGADDRWYLPSREVTVRQRRLGPGPVIETAVRIPSGDAISRCYGISTAQGPATVIEVHNASPVPVALALAVRPYDLDGVAMTGAHSIAVVEDSVRIDDRVVLALPRRPNEAGAAAGVDMLTRLLAGLALTGATAAQGEGVNAAVLFPLPHTATLRFVVPGPSGAIPTHLPEVDQVANGWGHQLAPGGRFVLPDTGMAERVDSARIRVQAESVGLADAVADLQPDSGRVLEALALAGLYRECGEALGALAASFPARLPDSPAAAAAVISGASRAATMIGVDTADDLLETLLQITQLVERSGDRVAAAEALMGLGGLLRHLGQFDAAESVTAAAAVAQRSAGQDIRGDIPGDLGALTELSEAASSVGSWGDDDVAPAARFWIGARDLVLRESTEIGGGISLSFMEQFPSAWRGGNFEIIRAATTVGPASFAIRWHGARPALLWDVETIGNHPVVLRCPGLDPQWSTTEAKGETLLAGTAEDLPPAPGEGESFS